MPVKPDKESGPRKLEAVKVRLRAEQVAREKAAVLRYRQLAEDEAEQPQRRTQRTERHTGKTTWLECFLCVLVVCCVLLVIAVVFLCAVVLSLSKKE
jgi:Flp pilus assembly protein TadB